MNRERWESILMKADWENMEGELGHYGMDGWEPVSMCIGNGATYVLLKRRLSDEIEEGT